MREIFKIGGIFILAVLILIGVLAAFNVVDIGFIKVFDTARENAHREVFENTKSYLHGVASDLGSYKEQYSKAKSEEDREIIRNAIRDRFPSVEASKIQIEALRSFLIEMRGY